MIIVKIGKFTSVGKSDGGSVTVGFGVSRQDAVTLRIAAVEEGFTIDSEKPDGMGGVIVRVSK